MKLSTNKLNDAPFDDVYTIEEDLGKGSFSIVRRCSEKATGEKWAVKFIDKEKIKNRFEIVQTEVTILELVHHPNIISLKEIFETPTHYLLVIELITGGELFEKIIHLTSYSESDARKVVVQLVSAIDHLHEKDIVHRDIKPENLLLSDGTPDATIKLADFGLSAILDPAAPLRKAVGTPGYIAPDVLRTLDDETCTYGKEADMWSVGIVLYILLCGFPPFYAEDDDEMFDLILDGSFSYPDPYWDAISEEAKDLINHLLIGDPKLRFTAKQVLEHKWVTEKAPATTTHLSTTIEELKKFHARRKWKGAIMATMFTMRKAIKNKLKVNVR